MTTAKSLSFHPPQGRQGLQDSQDQEALMGAGPELGLAMQFKEDGKLAGPGRKDLLAIVSDQQSWATKLMHGTANA